MDTRFLVHNAHLDNPVRFSELDPQLRRLKEQRYVYAPPLLHKLPINAAGIYSIGGARQIGKTTFLKQWMFLLLKKKISPSAIAFFSGELIDDHHSLIHLLQSQIARMPDNMLHYIILDEVTYIKDWDKAVKYAADAGWLDNTVLVLTGSDLVLMKEAQMRFPGRRGKSAIVNFHLYPLTFRECVQLKHPLIDDPDLELLFTEFNSYLLHGGYLTAINDVAMHGRLLESTLMTYSDWIRGDMLKRGKQESYLREILSAMIKRYGSQITWNALAQDLSIDHPATVADYVAQLESMDAVFTQSALLEDKLVAAPKKARKIMFADPFIFHAVHAWLYPGESDVDMKIKSMLTDSNLCSGLVEAAVATHYRRFYPTYYIKAEAEVDVAYVKKNRFWPIEIKWANQIRLKDLKQIMKYPNAKILTKNRVSGDISGVPTEPLPLALWNLDVIIGKN